MDGEHEQRDAVPGAGAGRSGAGHERPAPWTPSGSGAPPGWAPGGWAPGGWAPPPPWPHGPGRPGVATAAVVLGFVTAGLTALVTSLVLLIASTDSTDPAVVCLGLGLPCAVGLAAGATRLLRRRSHAVLFYSAVAAVAVLVLPVLVAVSTEPRGRALAAAVFMLVACPLPVLTAIFSTLPRVEGWAAAGRP